MKYFSLPDAGWSKWFALSFEAKMLVDTSQEQIQHGSLAIDDISFTEDCSTSTTTTTTTTSTTTTSTTTVPSMIDCDFESSTACDWQQVEDDSLDWTVGSGKTPNPGTGPQSDHTTQGEAGHYLYLQSVTASELQEAGLISPLLSQGEAGGCLEFWYLMYGLEVMGLRLLTEDRATLWESAGDRGLAWRRALVQVTNTKRVILSGRTGRGPRGDIALDDISFTEGLCPSQPDSVDFEVGAGGFVNNDDDTADWILARAESTEEGPTVDHSLSSGSGHYFLSNCSTGETFGRLLSAKYSSSVSCLRFWYNIRDTPVLNVNVKYDSAKGEIREEPHTQHISTKGFWVVDEVSLADNEAEFQLIFEFVCGDSDFSGYVALDDVFVTDHCTSLNCNFEEDCLWTDLPAEQVSWIIAMAELDHYGPDVDHTTTTEAGKFLYLENGLNIAEPQSAVFMSSPISDPTICMSFWFWKGGNDQESLNVDLFYTDTDHVLNSLWSSEEVGEVWSWQIVSLSVDTTERNISQDYRLGYLGELMPRSASPPDVASLAIDDIIVKPGECAEPLVTTPSPDPCVYHCDGSCVLPAQLCDYRPDCQDGRDESSCSYQCTFQSGNTCGWLADSDSPWVWTGASGASHDNTEGDYLSVSYSDSPGSAQYARLESPWLYPSYHSCKLTFWYFINSTQSTQGLLRVHLIDHNEEQTDLSQLVTFNTGSWSQHTAAVGRMSGEFKISFLGHLLTDTSSVSIDDISMLGRSRPQSQCYL